MTRYRLTNVLMAMAERKFPMIFLGKENAWVGHDQIIEEIGKNYCEDKNGPYNAWQEVKEYFELFLCGRWEF